MNKSFAFGFAKIVLHLLIIVFASAYVGYMAAIIAY